MNPILSYEQSTETIRQLPQNYLIAYKRDGGWICDPDAAADKELATRVFKSLFNYDVRYGDGLKLLSTVTPNNEFSKEEKNIIKETYDLETNVLVTLYYNKYVNCSPFFLTVFDNNNIKRYRFDDEMQAMEKYQEEVNLIYSQHGKTRLQPNQ